jgi:hypothetical protein
MTDYEIYSNLKQALNEKALISSSIIQVPKLRSLVLDKFAPNDQKGHSQIEFSIQEDNSPESREEHNSFKIQWDGFYHKVTILILTKPGGDVINRSDDMYDIGIRG